MSRKVRLLVSSLVFSALLYLFLPFTLPAVHLVDRSYDYDAIVVLGGGLTKDCRMDAALQERMLTALRLWRTRRDATLILTGGVQKGAQTDCVEATAMFQFALNHQIPGSRIKLENRALNTYQNARYTADLLITHDLRRPVVVTSDFHLKRANAIFQQYLSTHRMQGAKNPSTWRQWVRQVTKEQAILCFHAVFGFPENFALSVRNKKLGTYLKTLAQR